MFKKKPLDAISKVTVWDRAFDGHLVISHGPQLDLFATMWRTKEKLDEVWTSEFVKGSSPIDVMVGETSRRWIYHPSGRVWILTKMITPVYRVSDPDVMNEILGLS